MTNTNSNLKPTVGTIRKSIAPMPVEWLWRKVFQVCDRPRPPLAMYLATVDCATSIPSLSNSPWMRGAPHSRLARLISRIRRRISPGILGRPPRERDFQRQYSRNPVRCHRTIVSGRIIVTAFITDGNRR